MARTNKSETPARKPGSRRRPKNIDEAEKQANAVSKAVEQIVKKVRAKTVAKEGETTMVPSPSFLFNCAMSDDPDGGFSLGRMANLIGDSSSGKTFLAKSVLAEACQIPFFDDFDLIFDDVENADAFDDSYLFGQRMADRVRAPHINAEGDPEPSDTIEDFHFNICDALERGKPFIYILDSFDALDAKQDQEKIEKMREARTKGNKVAGSYGMSKPKKASDLLRNICGKMKKTNSVLIIISQTRDNIDPMSFEKKTRSGGRALKFYAHHEMWLAMSKKIPRRDLVVGNHVRAKVSKNKCTGKVREVEFPIYYDYGVDNISSCVKWLDEQGAFEKKKLTMTSPELGISGTTDKMVRQIEEKNLEGELKKLVKKYWNLREEDVRVERKSRYS